jgi:hypothetical protein
MPTHTPPSIHERVTVRDVAPLVTVRDVVRHRRYDLSGGERMLRVPYDLLSPVGPVRCEGGLITYLQFGELRNGQVSEGELRDASAGERVLLRLPADDGGAAPDADEWWLCEVEAIDGVEED